MNQRVAGEVIGLGGEHVDSVFQDDDLVGDLEYLLEPVRDIDDDDAFGGKLANFAEQDVALARRKDRCRSSRIRILGRPASALAISTTCCSDTLSSETRERTSIRSNFGTRSSSTSNMPTTLSASRQSGKTNGSTAWRPMLGPRPTCQSWNQLG